jgi:hypothetical protein
MRGRLILPGMVLMTLVSSSAFGQTLCSTPAQRQRWSETLVVGVNQLAASMPKENRDIEIANQKLTEIRSLLQSIVKNNTKSLTSETVLEAYAQASIVEAYFFSDASEGSVNFKMRTAAFKSMLRNMMRCLTS